MVRHWTPKPVIICSIRSSPTGGNFFLAVVKSFEYKIAISDNFVQTVKNSSESVFYFEYDKISQQNNKLKCGRLKHLTSQCSAEQDNYY